MNPLPKASTWKLAWATWFTWNGGENRLCSISQRAPSSHWPRSSLSYPQINPPQRWWIYTVAFSPPISSKFEVFLMKSSNCPLFDDSIWQLKTNKQKCTVELFHFPSITVFFFFFFFLCAIDLAWGWSDSLSAVGTYGAGFMTQPRSMRTHSCAGPGESPSPATPTPPPPCRRPLQTDVRKQEEGEKRRRRCVCGGGGCPRVHPRLNLVHEVPSGTVYCSSVGPGVDHAYIWTWVCVYIPGITILVGTILSFFFEKYYNCRDTLSFRVPAAWEHILGF